MQLALPADARYTLRNATVPAAVLRRDGARAAAAAWTLTARLSAPAAPCRAGCAALPRATRAGAG
jgi:hypothetical protein